MLNDSGLQLPQILSLPKTKFSECTNHNTLAFHRSILRIVTWYLNSTATLHSTFIFRVLTCLAASFCASAKVCKRKKKLPPLTHPPKFGCKTSTCSTLCISSYQILTTTWKQIIITQILPVSMWIIKYESYTSVSIHFLWWDWHINSNAWPDV